MPAVDLNDAARIRERDSQGMFEAVSALPEQCERALKLPLSGKLYDRKDYAGILVTGLGGSAIGGDLLRVYAAKRLSVPVVVNRDYDLPAYVDRRWLVFAVSYSGNTEETLSAYQQAVSRGADVIVLTTGGKLAAAAADGGIPVITVPRTDVPQPRAATGYLFIPMLVVLERMGYLAGVSSEVAGMAGYLRELRGQYGLDVPVETNRAKSLALDFEGRLPVVWGASGTTEVVAQRWKGQINENAKAPAYWNVFPELNHNEIVGFERPAEVLGRTWLVFLEDPVDNSRVKARMEITRNMVGMAAGVSVISAEGPNDLARMYSLVMLGDFASLYLAAAYGLDPGPVKAIDYLKGELAKR